MNLGACRVYVDDFNYALDTEFNTPIQGNNYFTLSFSKTNEYIRLKRMYMI